MHMGRCLWRGRTQRYQMSLKSLISCLYCEEEGTICEIRLGCISRKKCQLRDPLFTNITIKLLHLKIFYGFFFIQNGHHWGTHE